MNMKTIKTAVSALVLLAAGLFAAQSAHAASTFALKSDLRNHYQVEPGETIEDTIRVQNVRDETMVIAVEPRDYSSSPGYSHFPDAGSTERSNADWISFSPERLELGPKEEGEITYRMQVPQDADLSGSYWSVMMVEPADPEEVEPDVKEGFAVRQVIRYAVTISANIGETGQPDLTLSDVSIKPFPYNNGQASPRVQTTVKNEGSKVANFQGVIQIYNEQGQKVGEYANNRSSLFPGSGKDMPIQIDELEPGDYTAMLVLDTGEDESTVGARFPFTVEEPDLTQLADMVPEPEFEDYWNMARDPVEWYSKGLLESNGKTLLADAEAITEAEGGESGAEGESGQAEEEAEQESAGQESSPASGDEQQADSDEADEAA